MSDDVIVYGKTQAEDDNTLKAVFQRFSERGPTLTKTNASLINEGISPDPVKVEAIHIAPSPTTAKDVRSFLA